MKITLTRPVPDQERALANIESLITEHPHLRDRVLDHRNSIAALFSCSQFLATYVIKHPESLLDEQNGALAQIGTTLDESSLAGEIGSILESCASRDAGMQAIRRFRKDKQLIILLNDVLHRLEQQEVMLDMSNLADAVLRASLAFLDRSLRERFGAPENNAFLVIGMGKLGAQELNFSSDVDPVFVYRNEGETSGIATSPGVTRNRISAIEYYIKLIEELSKFLSANTADGFAYRVDLRLRPQGTRGSLALSLSGYEEYYESWGQLWERAALLRARPVAGDEELGREFLNMITPFIYRKYLDIDSIEEIRRMKTQVEQLKPGTFSRDIKRGFGGIREIEFFIQIFQLMYGGKEPMLRERRTLKALHRILQKGLIGYEDSYHLSENYLFLRTLEHRIQQMNDLQTHSLPAHEHDLAVLGAKMGYRDRQTFLEDLERRRLRVRAIYDSLFQQKEPKGSAGLGVCNSLFCGRFWDIDTPDQDGLLTELRERGLRRPDRALYHLTQIRNTIYSFQTLRGRRLMEDIIPHFLDESLSTQNPDRALVQLVDFSKLLATNESYLEPIVQNRDLIKLIISLFAQSDYLAKLVMSNPEYMGSLVEGEIRWRTRSEIVHELAVLAERKDTMQAVRLLRRLEEIRLGTRFLNGVINVIQLTHSLTTISETVITRLLRAEQDQSAPSADELLILGYGKLGGREISFNSDLDLVFMTADAPEELHIRQAENLLKAAMSYTRDGVAYSIDTRLRPDGNKGPLVIPFAGLRNYYQKHAHPWELQALLKARPVTGSIGVRKAFITMRTEVLTRRGQEVTLDSIRRMRQRIESERAKDAPSSGIIDIKLGSGGINEIEFIVQYLQLQHCVVHPAILVPNTVDALRRLALHGILSPEQSGLLKTAYLFSRVVDTMLRLRNENTLREEGDAPAGIARIVGMTEASFLEHLHRQRADVCAFSEQLG
ncbi:MAG TPA: bifunctional [glutamate--ammonia ligase]-adenylyl-L-tyrosine phosphorylase/[glutamate--ammonia-ligase] adenylyltransferase [Dissulfurispiraceae bacterium]|nr:bifunctional [glutamate--ammonia ligase]-adenylyl-L-tyrosine phosphorylase/[glutamate--ammonia-ligase] adenylyltransferase [Dissulfurispiraceae bacterium]